MSIYQSCHLPNFFKRVLFHFPLCVPFRSISSESKHTDVISEGVKHSHDTFSRTYQTLFHFYFKPTIRQKADTDIASIIIIIIISIFMKYSNYSKYMLSKVWVLSRFAYKFNIVILSKFFIDENYSFHLGVFRFFFIFPVL